MKSPRNADAILLNRETLYKEVWQTPILQLAKKYGISDVALSKICTKMNIPRPPRGYWTKHNYGHKTKQPSLAPINGETLAQVFIDKSVQEVESLFKKRRELDKQRKIERQKVKRLMAELEDLDTSRRIRIYLAMLRNQSNIDPERAEFLAWAEKYADHLDPATGFRMQLLEAE